jgi:hypothetical protein
VRCRVFPSQFLIFPASLKKIFSGHPATKNLDNFRRGKAVQKYLIFG